MEANVKPGTVREFWFGGPDLDGADLEERIDFWFAAGREVDAEIARRFGAAVDHALGDGLDDWRDPLRDRLALVILLDQFPRNLYRGTPKAFAGDRRARALTVDALDDGSHETLALIERAFLYMPLQHAEDARIQRRSVKMFETLLEQSPDELRIQMKRFLASARTHCEIIEKFGRFPHRNRILGRECTQAEIEFLRTPAAPFRSKS